MTQKQGLTGQELVKYPKIHTLGSEENTGILDEVIVVESKVDGAQFRMRYIPQEDKLIFGSRNNLLLDNTDSSKWIAIRAYKKAFLEHKDAFIPNVIYFSESLQPHTIKYSNIPDTIGYDVFDLERMEFYDWKAAKQAFENIGIPFINVHFEKHGRDVTPDELKELIKQSPYRKEGDEGIVIKCYKKLNIFGRPLFAKIVDDLFKEENKKVFKASNKPVQVIESDIADRYLTQPRFEKAILHFRDNGESIDMSLMPKLFIYLRDDILSENILYIIEDYKHMNFGLFTNIIAARTAKMLKGYLLTRA